MVQFCKEIKSDKNRYWKSNISVCDNVENLSNLVRSRYSSVNIKLDQNRYWQSDGSVCDNQKIDMNILDIDLYVFY